MTYFKSCLLTGILAMLAFGGLTSTATAEDWMFRRSYFTHAVPEGMPLPPDYPQPVSRSAYRVPLYPDGFGVETAYRINNYQIINGGRIDRTIYREAWVQFRRPGP